MGGVVSVASPSGGNLRTGVGVLDKCVEILHAIRNGARSITLVSERTGFSRQTAQRLVGALEAHRLVGRDEDNNLVIGPAFAELAGLSAIETMIACAPPVLAVLRDVCGESAQLFRRLDEVRLCVAAAERPSGLKNAVPVGTALPMTAGSAAMVLLAWDHAAGSGIPERAAFTERQLEVVRKKGWAVTIGQRDPELASVSAPVLFKSQVIGAVCVAGPKDRMGPGADRRYGPVVAESAARLTRNVADLSGVEG